MAFETIPLPHGIRARFVPNSNGLTMHVLEAGFEDQDRPCVLLLHGFPELAYSWRKVMGPLAAAGFHVIAPDQRGYGRTTGWDGDYDGDLQSFRMLNLVRDTLGLVSALGSRTVAGIVGHDFGSPVAAWCALIRPDVFRSVVLMSAPFAGPPPLPFHTAHERAHRGETGASQAAAESIHDALAALPRPRKHYQWYYATREADANMRQYPQGLHAFLRAYYHVKSADWPHNTPFPYRHGTQTNWPKCRPTTSWTWTRGWPRPWRQRCPQRPRLPPVRGCPMTNSRCTVRSIAGRDSRGACSGIAAPHGARTALRSNCSPVARSMSRHCSWPARATGGLSTPWHLRADADERLHAYARLLSTGGGRSLGAAGAAGSREPITHAVSPTAGVRGRVLHVARTAERREASRRSNRALWGCTCASLPMENTTRFWKA